MMANEFIDFRMMNILGSGDVLVDLGCGGAQILDGMAGRFRILIGIDAYETRIKMRKTEQLGWEFMQADLNFKFPLDDNYADAVIANQVIEHIFDPRHFAAEIHRILKVGGIVLITTPNFRYVKHIWRLVAIGRGPRTGGGNTLDGNWDDGHIHYFTHSDLREIFVSSGFSSVSSQALVNLIDGNFVRKILDHFSSIKTVRELLSGNILLVARK